MKNALLFLLCIVTVFHGQAQFTRYIVRFKDKGNAAFTISNPSAYLSQRAIERRTTYSIPVDSADLPVTPAYITQVQNIPGVTVLNVSKWLNAVAVQVNNQAAITIINTLPFVKNSSAAATKLAPIEGNETDKFKTENIYNLIQFTSKTERVSGDVLNYGTGSLNEIKLHNGEFLHNIGLQGQGMQIAMLDNGYNNYTAIRFFDSARNNNQILGTWDFVNREANVLNDGNHGMQCFSTIVANMPGVFMGKAPKASFWLYKTEDDTGEFPLEEFNWACGAERADSTGADLISSSLGYGFGFDPGFPEYPYSILNGNTTMSSIAADIAARKGLLVFNSAGNAGAGSYHYITTPADADSIVCVGAVTSSGAVGSFSSYGPSADGQIKPDVASVGVSAMIAVGTNTVGAANGTSYSCPNMAGLSACLWQGFREFNNMKIVQALRQSSHKYNNPDDRVGYGIPNLKLAFANLLREYSTATVVVNNCNAVLSWNSKDMQAMKYEIERKAPNDTGFIKLAAVQAQQGAILANRAYQYTDPLTGFSGPVIYRIKQIIDTAATSFYSLYTDTVVANPTASCISSTVTVRINPNPVSGPAAVLEVTSPDNITAMHIIVYDANGRKLMQLQSSKFAGRKLMPINIKALPAGKYYVQVLDGNTVTGTAEMIKQ